MVEKKHTLWHKSIKTEENSKKSDFWIAKKRVWFQKNDDSKLGNVKFPKHPNNSVAFDFMRKKGLVNKSDKDEVYEKFMHESPERTMSSEDKDIYSEVMKERRARWKAKRGIQ